MQPGLIALTLATAVVAQGSSEPTTKVLNGTLQGAKCPSTSVNAFLSIPYAKPPVGDLRFASPQPWDQAFNGTLDATVAAPACPQFKSAFAESGAISEDCLFLDVWAPANATANSNLPVKVWLYGGSNKAGGISNPLYDGCFASIDTVQVSINYRVGPLGFLAYESLGLTGNYGIQDQLLGLRWVQENIAAFGGDPTRVLLFGQSAGAEDTLVLSSLPQAKSLMHAAILESGSYAPLDDVSTASKGAEGFVDALNCSTIDLACLRSASVDRLVAAFGSVMALDAFGPVLDGTLIASQPTTPKVPSIIGSTTDEGSLIVISSHESDFISLNQTSYDDYLYSTFSADNARLVNATYPISRFNSSVFPVFAAMSAVETYYRYRCTGRRLLTATAESGVPVWAYSFGHTPSCSWYQQIPNNDIILSILGPAHTSEIPFVFGQVDNLPRPDGNCSFTAAEKRLSAVLLGAWDNMTANANPGAEWPQFKVEEPKGLNIADEASQFDEIDYSQCDFWDKIIDSERANSTAGGNSTSTGSSPDPTSTNDAASSHRFGRNILSGTCLVWIAILLL